MPVRMIGFKDGRYLVAGEGRPRFFTRAAEARKEVRARRGLGKGSKIATKGRKLTQKSLDRK